MGYLTRVTGAIAITPPIPWVEVQDSPFVARDRAWVDRDVRLHITEEAVATPEGMLLRRHATAIVPTGEGPCKAYDIEGHVQEVVDAYGAGRAFTGRLDGEGEEAGDLWRLYVRGGRVVKVAPRIVWPAEDEQ